MKKILLIVTLLWGTLAMAQAQTASAKKGVEKACMNYLDGFYEGNEAKLKESLSPQLFKFGYWKSKGAADYGKGEQMTYEQALAFARKVLAKKRFPKKSAPKKVEVLDVMNHIAAAKVTAWWGQDYILLVKKDDKWMIREVLWEGPLQQNN